MDKLAERNTSVYVFFFGDNWTADTYKCVRLIFFFVTAARKPNRKCHRSVHSESDNSGYVLETSNLQGRRSEFARFVEKVGRNVDDIPDCISNPSSDSQEEADPPQSCPSNLNPERRNSPETCAICLIGRKTVVFHHCRHLITCEDCYKQLISIAKSTPRPKVPKKNPLLIKCPYCRKMSDADKCQKIFNV